MKFSNVLLFSLGLLTGPVLATSQTIILSTIQRSPVSTPDRTGMADLIAKEAFSRVGVRLIIDDIPAKRALINANKGIHDGDLARIPGVTRTYPNLLVVPEVTWVAEITGFSKDANIKHPNWDSLSEYNVAYVRGWVVFERNVKKSQSTTQVITPESLFTLLNKNRTDIALYEKKMGYGVISEMGIKGIQAISPTLLNTPIHIYLHKKHKKLIPKISEAIKAMKRDGTYEKILRKSLSKTLTKKDIDDYIKNMIGDYAG